MNLLEVRAVKTAISNASTRPEFAGGNSDVKMAFVYDDLTRQLSNLMDKANGDYDETLALCRVIREVQDNAQAIVDAKNW